MVEESQNKSILSILNKAGKMPAVNVAMERSLGQGFVELMVASLRPAFERRNTIPGQINDVKTAFSSWDNCMKASYCK